MKNQDSLDKIIRQAVSKNVDNIDVPDMSNVWQNIELHVKRKRRIKRRFISGAIAAVLILALSNVLLINDGYASYFRTLKYFINEKDDITEIEVNTKTPGEINIIEENISKSSIIEHENGFTQYNVSLDMAQEISTFRIVEPSYLPQGYEIDEVQLMVFNEKTFSATLIYTTHDKEQYLEVSLVPMYGESAGTINLNPKFATAREEYIDGFKYFIIEFTSGDNEIIWDRDEIEYKMRTNLEIEESIKTATSFRK